MRAKMQSFSGRLTTLEKNQEAPEETESLEESLSRDTTQSSSRWADHMEGIAVLMYTDLGDLDEDDDKENTPGTRLFSVSKNTETFLRQHFTARVDNPVCRQWREKHGAPRLPTTACPKLDKIMKQNLSSQTKVKDRQLNKTQALVLDAVGPLAFVRLPKETSQKRLLLKLHRQHLNCWETPAAIWQWREGGTSLQTLTPA